jgi:hypothetical protein
VPLGGLAGAEHDLAQPAVVCLEFAHLLQAGRRPAPWTGIGGGFPRAGLDPVDHVLEDRVDQLFLVGEVPIGPSPHRAPRGGRRREGSRSGPGHGTPRGRRPSDGGGSADLSKLAADYDTAARKPTYAPGNSAAQRVYGPGTRKSFADRTSEVAAADPATHISSRTAPFVLFHGSADNLVSLTETLDLHTALRARGIGSTRYVLTGAGHGDLSFTGDTSAGRPWSTHETMRHVVGFLGQHLK